MNRLSRRHFLDRTGAATLSTILPGASSRAQTDPTPAGTWRNAAPLPAQIQEIYPAVHDANLYVAGGIAARLKVPYFTPACYAYDPVADAWRQISDLPEPLHHAGLVSTGERLFCIGGFNGGYTHVWRMRDTIHELREDGWHAVTTLPAPQAESVISTAANGNVHIATGQAPRGEANRARSDHQETRAHWIWNPTDNRFSDAAPVPTARNSATGGWVNNQLIVVGGRTGRGNLATNEIYDPQSDQWHTGAPLPLPQAGTASAVVEDGLIVFGGEIFQPDARVFPNVWRYYFSRDEWQPLPDLPTPRHGLGAGRIGDAVYVIGGATAPGGSGTSNKNEVYCLNSC